jgi:hypothetical protein
VCVPPVDRDENLLRDEVWSLARAEADPWKEAGERKGEDRLYGKGSCHGGRKGGGVNVADTSVREYVQRE